MADPLKAQGLMVADAAAGRAVVLPLLIAFGAIAVGVIKICIGAGRGKPIGFLIALCVVSLLISLIALARRPLRSRKGDAVLEKLKERHIGPRQVGRNISALPAAEFASVVGLFGMTALAGTELSDLRRSLQPPSCSSSIGCGSSCGGGGCGGGCGGGGCGGGGCGGCSGG
jgi:uncharacterized protein (TIGR04222 family)